MYALNERDVQDMQVGEFLKFWRIISFYVLVFWCVILLLHSSSRLLFIAFLLKKKKKKNQT